MATLLEMTASQPTRTLPAGDVLLVQGEEGGDLFVLETGELAVERDGVSIATIVQPGTVVGEISVLLGIRNTATVRATRESKVKVIREARKHLRQDAELSFKIAALVAGRLDATSSVLADLSKKHGGAGEQGILRRIITALHRPADAASYEPVARHDLFEGR
jgi:CRP-like cAMP-binding protein